MAVWDPPTPLQIDYIDPDGNDWDLSDTSLVNGYVCTGIVGIDGVPVQSQLVPLIDGTARNDLFIAQPGTIAIGILITRPASEDENDYYALLDRIVTAFYHRRNMAPAPGRIVIQRPDGNSRQISVFTTSGLNTPEVGINNAAVFALSLQTPDPFWYDINTESLTFSSPGGSAGILPLLPIPLGSSSIFGTNTIYNNGGISTYPEWLVIGPGTPTFTNLTTGRAFALSSAIASGHVIGIKTKPGSQMAVDTTTGINIWDQLVLSSTRDLWPLVPGPNSISISMAGSTGATQVIMSWQKRWLRA
jgi:hypothetical protein